MLSLQFACTSSFAVVVQSLSDVWLFETHGLQHARLPCSLPSAGACSNSCTLSQWCHPTISSPVIPFSCLQSFPESGGQSIEAPASASVLPMNIQGEFPLGLTGLISLSSKELSRVFPSTTDWKYQFFGTEPSLWSNSTSVHDYWKSHSFDYMDLCQPSNISAF